jgi:hypothetical protein
MRYAVTSEGHYTVARKGKKWFFVSADPNHFIEPVGPFTSEALALEAAQHLENDYRRPRKKP